MILSIINLIDFNIENKFEFEKLLQFIDNINIKSDFVWLRIKDFKNIYKDLNLYKTIREKLTKPKLFISSSFIIAKTYSFDGVWLNSNSYNEFSKIKDQENYSKLLIGYSAHSIDEINKINADFYTLSPIFYTPKDYIVNPLGKINIKNLILNKKVFALGGMTLDMENEFIKLGFCGIAGIRFNHIYM